MAVTEWIDEIAKTFEVDNGKGGLVKCYRMYEDSDFPESLSVFPCALSYITGVRVQYSLGGPFIDLYDGVTEFHLVPNVSKKNLPFILPFFARIRDAAAGRMTLGGRVNYFMLKTDEPSISLVTLKYGSEDPHLGLMVRWLVKDNVSGDFTPAA